MIRQGILYVIVVMLIVTSGCGGDKSSQVPTESDSVIGTDESENEVLRIMLIGTDDVRGQINQRIREMLLAKYDDIDFEFVYVEEYWDYIRSMNSMGKLPDVFYADSMELIVPLIDSGSVLDLRPYIEADGFIDNYSIDLTVAPHTDGGIYSVQSGADTYFCSTLFYNKRIFDDLSLSLPRTWKSSIRLVIN